MSNFDLEELSFQIHNNSVNKGFWSDKDDEDRVNQILAKMMLVDTEVSELAEAYVKSSGSEAILKEFSDIIIRVLDLYAAMIRYKIVDGVLSKSLIEKIEYNKTRPPKHNRLM